MALISLIV